MAYTLSFGASLGPGSAGLTLHGQLVDTAGDDSGAEISTGIVEEGTQGHYLATVSVPDGFRGALKLYESGSPTAVLAWFAINPQEAEYLDAQVSTVGGTPGAGSETVTIGPLASDVGGAPIEGAAIWVTSDLAGNNVEAGTVYTDTLGVATIYLDPGPYYLWRQHSDYTFANPTAFTVTDE